MPTEKPVVKATATQNHLVWEQNLSLEVRIAAHRARPLALPTSSVLPKPTHALLHGTQLHHELGLKTKRYESRGRQAPARNPITPLTGAGGVDPCASVRSSAAALTAGADFSALNSPPMMLNRSVGNPILGYSVHPLPQAARAELLDGVGPPHSSSPSRTASAGPTRPPAGLAKSAGHRPKSFEHACRRRKPPSAFTTAGLRRSTTSCASCLSCWDTRPSRRTNSRSRRRWRVQVLYSVARRGAALYNS